MSIVGNPSKQKRVKPVIHSVSTQAQTETEYECRPFFVDLASMPPTQLEHLRETGLLHNRDESLDICLLTDKHVKYLQQTWNAAVPLRMSFVSLDASRPWMLYWTLHACDLLGNSPSEEARQNIVATLKSCWTPVTVSFSSDQVQQDEILLSKWKQTISTQQPQNTTFEGGGFGGGPGQLAHAATNYGAVLALCIIAANKSNNHLPPEISDSTTEKGSSSSLSSSAAEMALELLTSIRFPLYVWIKSLQRVEDGAYVMHHDGERDVRATYCLMAVAKLLGIMTPQLANSAAIQFVASCQTWEGGFGGEPGSEAHGGYAFCATAALQLMRTDGLDMIDVQALTGWLARRQMSYEGGFNGRSNKLVDGCYSFWQGGAMAILSMYHHLRQQEQNTNNNARPTTTIAEKVEDPWFAGKKASLLFDEGMLERYILLCGQEVQGGLRDKPSKRRDFYHSCYCLSGLSVAQSSPEEAEGLSFGHERAARVHATHPCYNIRIERAQAIVNHFKSMPL